MASLSPEESVGQNFTWPKPCPPPRKPRVLLAACGCLSAAKFGQICQCFLTWADINTVVTENARVFLERLSFPHNVQMFSDIDQGRVWSESGPLLGSPLPDALSKWADVMVVAPIYKSYFICLFMVADCWRVVRQFANNYHKSMGLRKDALFRAIDGPFDVGKSFNRETSSFPSCTWSLCNHTSWRQRSKAYA